MRKFITTFVFVILFFTINAQYALYEDFENGLPTSGWTFSNTGSSEWQLDEGNSYLYGTNSAFIPYGPQGEGQDSWMITPAIDLNGMTSPQLLFADMGNYTSYYAFYEVVISDNVNMTGASQLYTGPAAEDAWTQRTIDLSAYNDGVYYIGFHYTGVWADDWWIDNVAVGEPASNDAKLLSIDTKQYNAQGDIDISGTLINFGMTEINSVDINYQIDGGTTYSETISGLTLGNSETHGFTFSTPWSATPGSYTLTVWVSNMNGNGDDDDTSNDLLSQFMSIATQSVQNLPFYEEFTSSTCGPCASFNSSTFTPFMNAHPDDIAVIKYQMSWPSPGDPYYTPEGGVRRTYYGVNAVPSLITGGAETDIFASGFDINDTYDEEIAKPAFFSINATHEINGDEISVSADITPYITAQDFTVHMVVIEKLTTGNVGNNGETEFRNVMMKMLPDASGTVMDFTAGVQENISYTQDMSSTNVEEMNDLAVVVFVQNDATKDVFQSANSIEILPPPSVQFDPANGETDVNVLTDILITFNQTMRLTDDSPITNDNVADFIHLSDPSKADIPFTASVNGNQSEITITPDSFLPELTDITITLDDGEIENLDDVALAGESITFTTASYPMANVTFDPADGAGNVDITTNITLTFDNAMRLVNDDEITNTDIADFVALTDASGNIAFSGTINAEKTIITLDPDQDLPYETDVTVTITGNEIENEFDIALQEAAATFTTEQESGINSLNSDLRITPNPANAYITVSNASGAVLMIMDISGKTILTEKINSENHRINMNSLESGVYIVHFELNGKTANKRLIINK